MSFNEKLAERVRTEFVRRAVPFVEKRMMGGLCFLVDGKMCLGVEGERLMVRLDPAIYDAVLDRDGCGPMDFTGRPMRGFVFVTNNGWKSARQFRQWFDDALEFNPRAKSSRSRQLASQPKPKE